MVVGFACHPLADHDRAAFSCGVAQLDDFIRTKARKEHRLFGAVLILAPDEAPTRIAGYYTLASQSIELTYIPETIRKKIPRYPHVPATLLARLAVSSDYQGQRLGEQLLLDALKRAHAATLNVGSFAVAVDPIDDGAQAFYEKYGFIPIAGSKRMVMFMDTIAKLAL
jgi:ribosomal protein S18 acetylase RimI-like enzyme